MYNVAVVGGGPAGLMAALELSKIEGIAVYLIEKNDQIGKKIKASGGGMCNYTQHAPADLLMQHYGMQGQFLKHAFKQLDAYKTETLLNELGIIPLVREDGKVFPASLDAKQWLAAFDQQLKRQGVEFVLSCALKGVEPCEGGGWWLSLEERGPKASTSLTSIAQMLERSALGQWRFDAVVLALGGASYPGLGTSGDGYAILNALELPVIPPRPALAAIVLESPLSGLEGIAVPAAQLCLSRSGKPIKMAGQGHFGPSELLITHKGLSGPLILNSSRWYLPGDELLINWLGWSATQLDTHLLKACELHGKRRVTTVLGELALPGRLVAYLIQQSGLSAEQVMAELTRVSRQRIVTAFTAFNVGAFTSVGFSQAMATAGGLALEAVSPKTMAVKGREGLYVVGELLDIDGDTGGYNIQAALTSGFVAARDLIKRVHGKQ